jgi:hypothetical protein
MAQRQCRWVPNGRPATCSLDALHRASVVFRAQLAHRRQVSALIGSAPVSSASQTGIQRQRDAMHLALASSVKASDRRAGHGTFKAHR